jgi:hypothetical protein
MKPRVFISHSGNEGETGALLTALVEALEASAFTPLIDLQVVVPGTDFHHDVDWMLATCDAAIVVMNKRAHTLESTWVLTEAGRLRDRVFADPGFQVLVLYTEGLTVDDLRNGQWAPTRLTDMATLPVRKDPVETARATVEQLAETRELFEARAAAQHVRQWLVKANASPETLRTFGEQLTERPLAGEPVHEVARRLVTSKKFGPLIAVCKSVAAMDCGAALEILRFTLPFLWIRREAAAQLVDAVVDGTPVAVNTEVHETAKAYSDVGCPAFPLWGVHALDVAGSGRVEDLLAEADRVVDAAAGELDLDLVDELDGGSSQDLLTAGIVMLVVPCANADRDTVQGFVSYAAAKKGVGVILKIGHEPTQAAIDALRSTVRYLDPPIDTTREGNGLQVLAQVIKDMSPTSEQGNA